MIRLPFVSRARYDLAIIISTQARTDLLALRNRCEQDRADFNALLDKYHALKVSGAQAPIEQVVHESPLAQLGPLTRSALNEMSSGQSGAVKRTMANKTIALWQQHSNDDDRDKNVAKLVFRGDRVPV